MVGDPLDIVFWMPHAGGEGKGGGKRRSSIQKKADGIKARLHHLRRLFEGGLLQIFFSVDAFWASQDNFGPPESEDSLVNVSFDEP